MQICFSAVVADDLDFLTAHIPFSKEEVSQSKQKPGMLWKLETPGELLTEEERELLSSWCPLPTHDSWNLSVESLQRHKHMIKDIHLQHAASGVVSKDDFSRFVVSSQVLGAAQDEKALLGGTLLRDEMERAIAERDERVSARKVERTRRRKVAEQQQQQRRVAEHIFLRVQQDDASAFAQALEGTRPPKTPQHPVADGEEENGMTVSKFCAALFRLAIAAFPRVYGGLSKQVEALLAHLESVHGEGSDQLAQELLRDKLGDPDVQNVFEPRRAQLGRVFSAACAELSSAPLPDDAEAGQGLTRQGWLELADRLGLITASQVSQAAHAHRALGQGEAAQIFSDVAPGGLMSADDFETALAFCAQLTDPLGRGFVDRDGERAAALDLQSLSAWLEMELGKMLERTAL